jgi:hypothetical protein
MVPAHALENVNIHALPIPGSLVEPSDSYTPILLKGMTLYSNDPFQFDFIVDSGHSDDLVSFVWRQVHPEIVLRHRE